MSEDSIKIYNIRMRILFEWGLYSNADSICDFTVVPSPHILLHSYPGEESLDNEQGCSIYLNMCDINLNIWYNIYTLVITYF